MKLPLDIEQKIRRCAKYSAKAFELDLEIRQWFDDVGLTIDGEDSGNIETGIVDVYIDSITQTGSNPDDFIKLLKSI